MMMYHHQFQFKMKWENPAMHLFSLFFYDNEGEEQGSCHLSQLLNLKEMPFSLLDLRVGRSIAVFVVMKQEGIGKICSCFVDGEDKNLFLLHQRHPSSPTIQRRIQRDSLF